MKVLLISPNTEKINMTTLPLGLACVAAATRKAGHDVAMVDFLIEKDTGSILKEAIEGFGPQVIGISVRNIDDQNMASPRFLLAAPREVVAHCQSLSKAPIVLGGAGYSIFPHSALSFLGADIGLQGEGEGVFPQLLERLERGEDPSGLPGVYLAGRGIPSWRTFVKDLDSLPLPDAGLWSLPAQKEDLWMPVQTRRGCPLRCSYCSTGTIEGQAIRRRSPQKIIQWIARWRQAGISRFHFVDNTFNLPPAYAREICRQLIAAGLHIRWWSILYPRDMDEELIKLMARAGCEQVSLGFESGSAGMLKKLNKRFTLQEVRRVSGMLAEHGIRQMGFLLLGAPDETKQSVEESLVFADSLNLDNLKITIGVRIYPETALARRAVGDGLISSEDDLLYPRFYLAKSLEEWLPQTLKELAPTRPHWLL